MAESLGLGYLVTGIIVAVVIVCVVIARQLKLNSVLSFWIIYIMTRPMGASIGDLLSQPAKYGGLGLGATATSAIFLFGILGIVLYFTFSKRDVITKSLVEEKEATEKGFIWQTVITIAVFIIIGGSAYFWRHQALQKEIKQPVSNVTPGQNTSLSPLGDLSVITKITEDTRSLVIANNLTGAKTRVADLEYEWDNAQSRLKPMNGAKWTEVDNAIDKVLRQLRAVNPNQQDCKSSLDTLLAALK
jgi:preprotein translocase subunit YajC